MQLVQDHLNVLGQSCHHVCIYSTLPSLPCVPGLASYPAAQSQCIPIHGIAMLLECCKELPRFCQHVKGASAPLIFQDLTSGIVQRSLGQDSFPLQINTRANVLGLVWMLAPGVSQMHPGYSWPSTWLSCADCSSYPAPASGDYLLCAL